MTRYLLKRALSSVISLFIFLTFVFFATAIIIPHDFDVQFALFMSRTERDAMREELGIDQPIWVQYAKWVGRLVRGSLGTSFYGFPVAGFLKSLLAPTLLIFLTGTYISFVLGQWLGKATAWKGPGWFSSSVTFSAITLYTSFPPLLSFLITYILGRRFNILRNPFFRGDAMQGLDRLLWAEYPWSVPTVMWYMMFAVAGVLLFLWIVNKLLERVWQWRFPSWVNALIVIAGAIGSWFALGFGPLAFDVLAVTVSPLLLYVLLSFGETMLVMQTSMQDTLGEEYITAAQAKGIPDRVVRDRHAARNALLPVLSRLLISLPYLLTGLVIVEDVVGWRGMSQALFDSLYQQDMPTVMGGLLVVGVIASVARLTLDVLYAYLDPRIRHKTYSAGEL
jgi:peptide/nickel transport system permease protein